MNTPSSSRFPYYSSPTVTPTLTTIPQSSSRRPSQRRRNSRRSPIPDRHNRLAPNPPARRRDDMVGGHLHADLRCSPRPTAQSRCRLHRPRHAEGQEQARGRDAYGHGSDWYCREIPSVNSSSLLKHSSADSKVLLLSGRTARDHDHADDDHHSAHSARHRNPDRRDCDRDSTAECDEAVGELPFFRHRRLPRNRNSAYRHRHGKRLIRHCGLRHASSVQRHRAMDQKSALNLSAFRSHP
jgi:hypothetical protein